MGVKALLCWIRWIRDVVRPQHPKCWDPISKHPHTPKAVAYHKQSHYCEFMIGHSLGRMQSRFRAILIVYNVWWTGPGGTVWGG